MTEETSQQPTYTREQLKKRIDLAGELFASGFNCAQSVVAAFADLYGIDRDTALKMSAPFGGGIGRMRETCGSACGIFMLTGFENGQTDPANRLGKGENYKLVQELAAEFRRRNGSCVCRELLGLNKETPLSPLPEARTTEYYKKRPCPEIVREAATIYCEHLCGQKFDK